MGQLLENAQIELSSPQRILVVEDHQGCALVTTSLLNSLGYDFDVAKDGNEAVQKAKSGRYALILMDVSMPSMDGHEATRCIRDFESANGSKPLSIIGVTANALVNDKELCHSAGMNDYISKPIDFRLLEKKIKALLEPHSELSAALDATQTVAAAYPR